MIDPPIDLVTMLARQAHAHGPSSCLVDRDGRLTFADLDTRATAVADALAAQGPVAGDRVVLLAQACPAVFELLFGCAKAGTILVPLNWRLSPREIAQIVANADPALIIVTDALRPLLAETAPYPTIRLEDYPAWRDAATTAVQPPVDPDAAVLILYTSGTTGLPKGVTLSQRNLSYLGRMAGELWAFTAQSVNLIAMPLFHIGGIGYGLLALSQGGETVIERRTEPAILIETMRTHRVTHAFFVPTVIQRLVDYLESDAIVPPQVAHMFYGAAPIGEALLRRAIAAFGSGFYHVYGLTETAGTNLTLDPADHDPDGANAPRLRSCGRPMPWIELALIDPDTGTAVGVGEVGEIRIRSPVVMSGYWRDPAETALAITPDGWLRTGDAAVRDADGYVFIHDRYKDMIVSGGENIYPSEIDNVLQHHADIVEVAVVGIPHETWGETPRAFVVRRPGASSSERDILDFARDRLAHYKCPTSVVFIDALPRNASGKILKRELRS